MNLLIAVVSIFILLLGGSFLMFRFDRRWYKSHPGAEEEFARTDQELEKKGL